MSKGRANTGVGAAQCRNCGRFFRTRRASACPSCGIGGRAARRLARRKINSCKHQPKSVYSPELLMTVIVCTECGLIMRIDDGQ